MFALVGKRCCLGSDVHCVSDVSPYGEAITSLRLAATSLFYMEQRNSVFYNYKNCFCQPNILYMI